MVIIGYRDGGCMSKWDRPTPAPTTQVCRLLMVANVDIEYIW